MDSQAVLKIPQGLLCNIWKNGGQMPAFSLLLLYQLRKLGVHPEDPPVIIYNGIGDMQIHQELFLDPRILRREFHQPGHDSPSLIYIEENSQDQVENSETKHGETGHSIYGPHYYIHYDD